MDNFAKKDKEIAKITFEDTDSNFDETDEELTKFLNSEEIYMDFDYINELASITTELSPSDSNEVSSIESDQKWGNYTVKPQSQVEWDNQLQQISSILTKFEFFVLILPGRDDCIHFR